jgi:hypothetical protein
MSRESTVGMTDKLPVLVGRPVSPPYSAALWAYADTTLPQFRSKKRLFAPNPLAIAIRLLAGADRAAEFRVALSTERDRR